LSRATGLDFEDIAGSKVRLTKEEKKARERVDSLDSHSSNSDEDDYETYKAKMKEKRRAKNAAVEMVAMNAPTVTKKGKNKPPAQERSSLPPAMKKLESQHSV
jgi:hypothetical protein